MKAKNVKLYRTSEAPYWKARYRVKVFDPVRGIITRQRNVSTQLPNSEENKAAAQKIANDRRDEDMKKFWLGLPPGKQAEPMTLRDSIARWSGQIVEVPEVFLSVVADRQKLILHCQKLTLQFLK